MLSLPQAKNESFIGVPKQHAVCRQLKAARQQAKLNSQAAHEAAAAREEADALQVHTVYTKVWHTT